VGEDLGDDLAHEVGVHVELGLADGGRVVAHLAEQVALVGDVDAHGKARVAGRMGIARKGIEKVLKHGSS
jgi:hypothetical protein